MNPTTTAIPVACFAPPLTDEKLAAYTSLIESTDATSQVGDALRQCLACVKAWYALPVSTRTDVIRFTTIHKGNELTYAITPLEKEHVTALWDVTPWMTELNTYSNTHETGLFDALSGDLRNCAFDLLWHAKEITLDREPLTQDMLR